MIRLLKTDVFIIFFGFMIAIYLWLCIDQASCMQYFAPVKNRELGVIEIGQTLVLIAILILGLKQFFRNIKPSLNRGLIWGFFTIAMIFVLLEEIDYGLHYYDFLMGNEPYTSNLFQSFRNIHNQADNNNIIKTSILIPQIIIFGILPFLNKSIGNLKFGKRYALFYWTVLFSKILILYIHSKLISTMELDELHKSQLPTEMQELAFYFMFWIFLYEYKNQLFINGFNFLKSQKKQ